MPDSPLMCLGLEGRLVGHHHLGHLGILGVFRLGAFEEGLKGK